MHDNPYSPPAELENARKVSPFLRSGVDRFVIRLAIVAAGSGLLMTCWGAFWQILMEFFAPGRSSTMLSLPSPFSAAFPPCLLALNFRRPMSSRAHGPTARIRTFALAMLGIECFNLGYHSLVVAPAFAGDSMPHWAMLNLYSIIQSVPVILLTLAFVCRQHSIPLHWGRLIGLALAGFLLIRGLEYLFFATVFQLIIGPALSSFGQFAFSMVMSFIPAIIWVGCVGCLLPFLGDSAQDDAENDMKPSQRSAPASL